MKSAKYKNPLLTLIYILRTTILNIFDSSKFFLKTFWRLDNKFWIKNNKLCHFQRSKYFLMFYFSLSTAMTHHSALSWYYFYGWVIFPSKQDIDNQLRTYNIDLLCHLFLVNNLEVGVKTICWSIGILIFLRFCFLLKIDF